MSKFAKALEQAQRERAMRRQASTPAPTHALPPPNPQPRSPLTPPPPAASSTGAASQVGAPRRRPTAAPRRPAIVTGQVESHLVSLVAPSGPDAEQYRALRHVVEQRHKSDAAFSIVAVSSPGIGDGKTTTAINLAGSLAQGSDNSVLLVEADLRRPSIGAALGFNGSNTLGLVDAILNPDLRLESIVQPRPPYNLSVVVAGQVPPSPYEILKSPRLGALLDEARSQYDYIIMDTPPLAIVQDCRVVARWVDGLLMVVAAHQTPRALLETALDVVDPTKLVGIVFNGFDHLSAGGRGSHYSYYSPSEPGENGHRSGPLTRIGQKVGSMLRGGEEPEVGNRRGRDRSR